MEIGGFAGAAATGNNARRNDQATEEGQTDCANSASLQAASKAACIDKSKVKLDKSARFGESLQPGTVMWECQGESARHNKPSPCGALEPVAAVGATEGSRKVVPDQFAATTGEMGGRLIKHARYYFWRRAISRGACSEACCGGWRVCRCQPGRRGSQAKPIWTKEVS